MSQSPTSSISGDRFAATRWSLVAAAAGTDTGTSRQALIELCLRYWYPVYAFIRGSGQPPEMAQEIVKAFFEHLVQQRLGEGALDGRVRFREFLLQALEGYLQGDWKQAQEPPPVVEFERGGRPEALEARYSGEDRGGLVGEQAFQRDYALDVLASALSRLREEARRAGREPMFEAMQPFLSDEPGPGDYQALSQHLGLQQLAVVVALKRLRQRFRELADAELGETVASRADLSAERAAVARGLALK